MPNAFRYFLYSLVSLGLIIIAVTFFWVFLIILGVIIIARIAYMKLFNKGTGSVMIYRYTMKQEPPNTPPYQTRDDSFTTVIDADNPEEEYQIPKIK